MLTKESSLGFNEHSSYPTYEYRSKQGNRVKAKCDGGRILPKPRGYTEIIRYQNADEDFRAYLKWIERDCSRFSDLQLLEHPYGIFVGAWSNARWMDEIKRRGLA